MVGHHRNLAAVAAALMLLLVIAWSAPARSSTTRSSPAPSGPNRSLVDTYVVPVAGTVTDPFRSPENPYAAGNRGIEYEVAPGAPVVASAAGEVVFAGSVAGGLHVTVRHADGLRTSYSFLASVTVRPGAVVERGQQLGTTGALFHFGVRDPAGAYLDPALVLGSAIDSSVRLVPSSESGAEALRVEERRGFLELASQQVGRFLPGVRGAPATLAVLAHYAVEQQPITRVAHLVDGLERWHEAQDGCTPEGAAPPPPDGRRILVLVAGFGSSSDAAGVDQVDHQALGYADGDVVRFSYNGGRIPSTGVSPSLAGLAVSTYGPADSQRDLVDEADLLATLVAQIAAADPGVPIDIVGHSQGGVVSRLAVLRADATGTLPPDVQTLVTLSAPHGGADIATALNAVTQVGGADQTLAALQDTLGLDLDANSVAAAELSEVSPLTEDLAGRGVPDQLNFVSVGARGDPVVANPRTAVEGEAHVVVDLAGLRAHDQLPGTAAATREIGLARAGLGPTCSGLFDATLDVVVGESISWATDQVGATGLVLTAPLP